MLNLRETLARRALITMMDTTKTTEPPSVEPCGNDDCDKCDQRPRWKISQHRIQHLTHEREIKAASEEEALRLYEAGTAWPSSYDDRGGAVVQRDPVQIERLPPDKYHLTECCWHDLRTQLPIAVTEDDSMADGAEDP